MRRFALLGLSFTLVGCLGDFNGSPAAPDGGSNNPPPGATDLATAHPSGPAADLATAPAQPPPPGSDLTPTPLGNQLCEATLSLSGTYVQGNAPPTGFPGGCWPDGTWTFTATVTTNGCSSTPQLAPQYQFKVTEDMDYNDSFMYLTDPSNMYVSMQMSGGEGGVCVGQFIIYSSDGTAVTTLRPAMQADNSINGAGYYRVYDSDQRR